MTEKELLPFTPGPWYVVEKYMSFFMIADDEIIGRFSKGNEAKLASLAPQMFEVLSKLVKLKEFKDTIGETPSYCNQRAIAWDEAKKLLSQMYK